MFNQAHLYEKKKENPKEACGIWCNVILYALLFKKKKKILTIQIQKEIP